MNTWQTIDTAPKDKTRVLLYYPSEGYVPSIIRCGQWDEDKYAKRPRPYWHYDGAQGQVSMARQRLPALWMPMCELFRAAVVKSGPEKVDDDQDLSHMDTIHGY